MIIKTGNIFGFSNELTYPVIEVIVRRKRIRKTSFLWSRKSTSKLLVRNWPFQWRANDWITLCMSIEYKRKRKRKRRTRIFSEENFAKNGERAHDPSPLPSSLYPLRCFFQNFFLSFRTHELMLILRLCKSLFPKFRKFLRKVLANLKLKIV